MSIFGDIFFPDNPERRDKIRQLQAAIRDAADEHKDLIATINESQPCFKQLFFNNAALAGFTRSLTFSEEELRSLQHANNVTIQTSKWLTQDADMTGTVVTDFSNILANGIFAPIQDIVGGFGERDELEKLLSSLTVQYNKIADTNNKLQSLLDRLTQASTVELNRFAALQAVWATARPDLDIGTSVIVHAKQADGVALQHKAITAVSEDLSVISSLRQLLSKYADTEQMVASHRTMMADILATTPERLDDLYTIAKELARASDRPTLSVPGPLSVQLHFHNPHPHPARLDWVDPKGNAINYGFVAPSETKAIHSCLYHVWSITYADGQLALYVTNARAQQTIQL